jgi:hypothetical protein
MANPDEDNRVKAVQGWLQFAKPGMKVLDIGCGDGKVTAHLSAQGVIVYGIDLIQAQIDKAKYANPEGIYSVMDARCLNFPDVFFDIIVASEMLEHLDNDTLKAVVGEMKRVTKPDGRIIASVPEHNCVKGTLDCPHLQNFGYPDLERLFNVECEWDVWISTLGSDGKRRRWIGIIANPRPKVSVIIPSYNNGRYLKDAINSVKNQSLTDWELIIVEDGSTDDSLQIASSFDFVNLIVHDGNKGVAQAWTDGFKEAKGDYMIILSSDDMLMPDTLQAMYDTLRADKNLVMLYGDILPLFEDGHYEKVFSCGVYDYKRLVHANYIGGAVMVSRELKGKKTILDEDVLYAEPDEKGACDWGLWLKISDYALRHDRLINKIEKPLYIYRTHKKATRYTPERKEQIKFWEKAVKDRAVKRREIPL